MKSRICLILLCIIGKLYACDNGVTVMDLTLKNLSGHSVNFSGIRLDENCVVQNFSITVSPGQTQDIGLARAYQWNGQGLLTITAHDPARTTTRPLEFIEDNDNGNLLNVWTDVNNSETNNFRMYGRGVFPLVNLIGYFKYYHPINGNGFDEMQHLLIVYSTISLDNYK